MKREQAYKISQKLQRIEDLEVQLDEIYGLFNDGDNINIWLKEDIDDITKLIQSKLDKALKELENM